MTLALKRMFDLLVAVIVLFLFSPLIIAISLAIKLDDGGPVFFPQERVGRNRRKFRCYKFRTMTARAAPMDQDLRVTATDPRITRVGRSLRLWTLDEIPQLFNVIKGEMSIIGPRPWVPEQAAYCSTAETRRFAVRPGMAGWAWIHGRNRLAFDERVRLDLWYVDHWSLKLDLEILLRAFVLLFRREGVYFDEAVGSDPRAQEN